MAKPKTTPNIDMKKAADDIAKFDGLPPYNTPGNFVYADGYFAQEVEKRHGMSIAELRKIVAKR